MNGRPHVPARLHVPILVALLPLALAGCSVIDEITTMVEGVDGMVNEATEGAEKMAHPDGGGSRQSEDRAVSLSGATGTVAVGQTLERNGVSVTLREIILSDDPGHFSPPPEGMVFLYPVFTIENQIPEEGVDLYFTSGASCKVRVDGGEEEIPRSMDALYSYGGDVPQLDMSVGRGETVEAMSAFVVPADWGSLEFRVERGFEPRIAPLNMSFTVSRPA